MARCSICYTLIAGTEKPTSCPECRQEYHDTCWKEIGGCAMYGCKQAAVAQKPALQVVVGQGWGDSKPCPACNATIGSSVLVCGCGARFPWADPMTQAEYAAYVAKQRALSSARTLTIWLFILTLLGFLAPITGTIAGIYVYARRKLLVGTGGTYLAMGYGSAAIAALYTLLIVLVAAGK